MLGKSLWVSFGFDFKSVKEDEISLHLTGLVSKIVKRSWKHSACSCVFRVLSDMNTVSVRT